MTSIATVDDNINQDGASTSIAIMPSTSSIFNALMLSQTKSLHQCGFCGISNTTTTLVNCLFCGSVAYCSDAHQSMDFANHQMICTALRTQGLVPNNIPAPVIPSLITTNPALINNGLLFSLNPPIPPVVPSFSLLPTSIEEPVVISNSAFSSLGSAFKPYRNTVGNSISSESVSSMTNSSHEASLDHLSSASLGRLGAMSIGNQSEVKTAPIQIVSQSKPPIEKIIPTDDPDIQIIETEGSVSSCKTKTSTLRNRKRPTPSNSAELKAEARADPKIKYKDHNKNVVYSTTLQEHQRHLQNRGCPLNIHQAMVLRLRYIAEHVIRSLNEFGWAVVDNFLGSDHYKFTSREIERLYERGLFSPGQLMEGKHKDEMHIKDIRSDHIYWFDGTDDRAQDAATVRLLISMIDSVIQHFKNRIENDIGGRSRAMLAIYPGNGTRYVKHVDNPVKDGRCITTIYYCNENWDMSKDGGGLRLYPETSMNPMDIDPKADRLVFFWSDRRNPHEVMPVYRHRFAITIWYMDKNERDNNLAKGNKKTESKKEEEESGALLSTPIRTARKVPSSHNLAGLELRMFPSTSSDPTLGLAAEDRGVENQQNPEASTATIAESTDSGISLSTNSHSHHHMERTSSLQSISDAFRSERSSERRSSTSSDNDFNDDLPPPPSENPEYMI